MATEQPKYSVEISESPFEVRTYAPTIVAAVHVSGTREEAVSAGFRILARYIFGDNQTQGKIAMTAPVTQSTSQKISMTAPVEQSEARGRWEVRFTMPAAYTLTTLPKPRDPRIEVLELAARRVAAVTFSGFWSDSNLQSHQAQLFQFLKRHQLTALSSPIYAYYDPPWTPWFWRTNEVLVDIAAASPSPNATAGLRRRPGLARRRTACSIDC
jgi:SOUL heme-binding protein